MPYSIRKLPNKDLYTVKVKHTGKVLSKGTTREKAEAQVRYLGMREKLKGGSVHIQDMKKFIHNSYRPQDEQKDEISGYKRDDSLSGRRSQTYYNHDTGKAVIVHRGSQGIHDWANNLLVPLGLYHTTNRYKHSEDHQKKTEDKYGKDNVDTIGHSIGAHIVTGLGSNSKNIIGYNRPPQYSQLPSNYYDVKKTGDIFYPFTSNNDKSVVMKSKRFNPIEEHKSYAIDKDEDKLIGSGVKTKTSPWIAFVKAYSKEHGVKYKDALKHCKDIYKK